MEKSERIPMNKNLKVLFVAGFGPIVRDNAKSREFYLSTLGLTFKKDGDYYYTQDLKGANHFALWPLSQAAQSCFGSDIWPSDVPIPQAWIEFDVEDLGQATAQLQREGYRLFVKARTDTRQSIDGSRLSDHLRSPLPPAHGRQDLQTYVLLAEISERMTKQRTIAIPLPCGGQATARFNNRADSLSAKVDPFVPPGHLPLRIRGGK